MNVLKGSNNIKKLKAREQNRDVEEFTIESLNDYCLLEIFQYLTINEKIRLQSVCTNLNRVAKISLNQIKSLVLPDVLPFGIIDDEDDEGVDNFFNYNMCNIRTKNINYLRKFLENFGSQLKLVDVSSYIKYLLSPSMLFKISKYCNNITDLVLYEGSEESVFNDANLKILFVNNPNISSISIEFLKINGDCLLDLNVKNIKKLSLEYFEVTSSLLYNYFLQDLKNLNSFQFCDFKINKIIHVIDALISNKCENISEIEIKLSSHFASLSSLLVFISNQKEIRKFHLSSILINQQILDKIPEHKLEDFNLHYFESSPKDFVLNISLFLSKQKNLHKLQLRNVLISTNKREFDCLERTTLEELSIEYSKIPSKETSSNISLFLSKLKNIQKLRLYNIVIDEESFKSLSTKNIVHLNLVFNQIQFPEHFLKYIKNFKNLQVFEISMTELNDHSLQKTSECININVKKIEIDFNTCLLSSNQISSFRRWQNLESFVFRNNDRKGNDPNIDNLLKDLLKCKNLIFLSISSCKFTNLELYNLSNLFTLELTRIEKNDEEIVEFIKKATNLKVLSFEICRHITNNLVKEASKIKIKRGDINVLEIFFDFQCKGINFYELKNEPLVNVLYL